MVHSKAAKQLVADGLVLNFSSNNKIFDTQLQQHGEILKALYQ
ncbi:MAG: hypothetical protein V5788_06220 [Shewanella sp.]